MSWCANEKFRPVDIQAHKKKDVWHFRFYTLILYTYEEMDGGKQINYFLLYI